MDFGESAVAAFLRKGRGEVPTRPRASNAKSAAFSFTLALTDRQTILHTLPPSSIYRVPKDMQTFSCPLRQREIDMMLLVFHCVIGSLKAATPCQHQGQMEGRRD